MATIERFEDIDAWKKARDLSKDIYQITGRKEFTKDFNLKDQIRRASTSIMLNIAEGFARKTDKDFARFLSHAHGSGAEVQAALYIALDQEYINKEEFEVLYKKTEEVSRMLMGFSKYLRSNSNDSLPKKSL